MAELHGELKSHFDLHKKALAVGPNSGRAAGEFWAAVLEPDKDVSNFSLEGFHWFKVKSKHTVAKVQKAYHKKCGVTVLLRQGDRVIPLTTQMQQINHFKDDIIIFSTSIISEADDANLSRMPLQSIDAASQNRMQTPSQAPVKAETEPASGSVGVKAEPDLSTVSPSPFETPAISRTSPEVVQFGTPALGQLDTPASAPTSGYDVFAESQDDYYRHSKLTAAGLETSLSALGNTSAPDDPLGYESFAEVHRENYTSSSATPAEIESSLRKIWDKISSDTREYYSTKDAQKSNIPISNNSPLLPAPAVDTKPLPGSFSPSANNRSKSVTQDDIVMKPDDYSSTFKDEDGSPEPEPQTLELGKLRIQHIMEGGSAEVLKQEVKKTTDFLNTLKNHFKVPEAESHPDTSHWLQQIDTLQAQVENTPTIIGVVGNTGAGKSSVINAMLDEERLVPTNCMRACTAVVTEMSWNFSDDPSKKYRAEIEFIKECDWENELKVSLNELIDASGNVSRDSTNADTEAGIAYAKIKAVYPNKTHEMLAKSTAEELLAESDVRTVLGTTRTIEKSYSEFFYKELQRYVDSKEKSTGEGGRPSEKKKEKRTMEFWPLIKVVRIFVKADALSTGAVIVDLPGVHDSNAARAAVAAGYMKQCTGLWICAPINRAVDDKAAKFLLGESFKRQLKYDGQFSRITFICSKTDDISVLEASDSLGLEDAMAEDYAMIDQIDKQIDELNAKIADLKGNIDVYSGVYNDADESLDIWDDLRRDLDAGEAVYAPKAKPEKSPKRKRSPSSRKSRKKMKISEDEDDDDFIDDDDGDQEGDEIFDEETEAEEEDLGRGDPLTIEDIEQKIDDLKDTKKQARKEKVALELEIKEVKKQSKELDQQRKEIDTRMRAICIDGRNKYSKGAIQQDFAAGIKELDMENAEEEDAEKFNPDEDIRDYDAVARSLPVFCVSSRAYQQLNGRLRKDAKIPGFRNIKETQIPQLQAHCKKLTEAGRSATYRRFLNALLQLVLSLSLWSNNDGTNINLSDSQKWPKQAGFRRS
ncbi:e1e59874-7bcb-4b1c-a282-67f13334c37c [Sclerotinia trifoliorum]|uniref:E1e59874-7bcb-4b1c-a282-67f13334c37c n=1 Tax=Sclerotinia trifoliorum TaxID=28548 RepID=A0A8H2ZP64_9HELO|nr:e1e59874-7bcb-4b1c-a282-67f13334c37c [Sclerotinia trifoliorum]